MHKSWVCSVFDDGIYWAPWYGDVIGGRFGCCLYRFDTFGLDGVE